MDKVIEWMFHSTPRYVGNPRQTLVENEYEITSYMAANSGFNPCFIGVYQNAIIDKVFFDIDYASIDETLKVAQKMFQYCKDLGIKHVIPNWSGSRGAHIYPLFKPEIHEDPVYLLRNFSYGVINETGTYYMDKGKKVPYADTRVIGDLRRLCRYPNTQRVSEGGTPLGSYCIPLDPARFMDMDISEVLDLARTPQLNIKYNFTVPTNSLKSVATFHVDYSEFKSSNFIEIEEDIVGDSPHTETGKARALIKNIIKRPCISKFLCTNNPPDLIRVAAVIELQKLGYKPNFIFNRLASLNWHDFDPDITKYQLSSIYKKGLTPMSKRSLNDAGLCLNPEIKCGECIRKHHNESLQPITLK